MIKLSNSQFKLIVFFAFLVNFILRLYKIEIAPFSYDESISVKDTLLDFGHIKHEAEWDSNPPFYHYCLWVWAKLFGITEFSLRSFSALLCSITMVIWAFFINKNYSKRSSIAFILLFSLHPVIFYYSQEARSYCLTLLLASLTFITFKNFLDSPNFKNVFVLGLLNFLLIYTHYITFYIPLFQTIIILLFQRSALKWFSLSALISLGLAFIRFTKGQFQLILGTSPNASSRDWLKKAEFNDLINFMNKMYFHYVIYLILFSYLCFIIYKYRNSIADNKTILKHLWLLSLLVPVVHYLIGLYIPLFVDRYILYSVMFMLIFVSVSIHYFKTGYILVLLIAVLGTFNLRFTYKKDFDFKSVVNYVKTYQANRTVIINTKDLHGLFVYYYDRNEYLKMNKDGNFNIENKNIFKAGDVNDFKQLPIDLNKDIMLFQGFDNEKSDKEIYDYFSSKGYKMLNINGFHGLKYILFCK